MDRVQTGSRTLDAALAGGIRPGTSLLVTGEEGAGATEFALTLLHAACAAHTGHKAMFASALRSAARVRAEVAALFEDGDKVDIEVKVLRAAIAPDDVAELLAGLQRGDVLVVESADALAKPGDGWSILPLWHELADAAQAQGVVLLLLHAPGTLPAPVEASLAEGADGVLRFSWQDGGPARRRILAVTKLRGLAPILGGDQVPLFEVALEPGLGYTISMEHSVV